MEDVKENIHKQESLMRMVPVRDTDFTDHGHPQNHPNPHQHEHKPNLTRGILIKDPKGQPVTGWSYS